MASTNLFAFIELFKKVKNVYLLSSKADFPKNKECLISFKAFFPTHPANRPRTDGACRPAGLTAKAVPLGLLGLKLRLSGPTRPPGLLQVSLDPPRPLGLQLPAWLLAAAEDLNLPAVLADRDCRAERRGGVRLDRDSSCRDNSWSGISWLEHSWSCCQVEC